MEFHQILATEAGRPGKPQHQRVVDRLAALVETGADRGARLKIPPAGQRFQGRTAPRPRHPDHGHAGAAGAARQGEDRVAQRLGESFLAPVLAASHRNRWNCSKPSTGNHAFSMASGELLSKAAFIRCSISAVILAWSAVTSGRPISRRASSGVMSNSILTFMPPETFATLRRALRKLEPTIQSRKLFPRAVRTCHEPQSARSGNQPLSASAQGQSRAL